MIVIEWIAKAGKWIGDNYQDFIKWGSIAAAVIIALYAKRFYKTLKEAIANLFTPSGFIFFLLSMAGFLFFLIKYNLI